MAEVQCVFGVSVAQLSANSRLNARRPATIAAWHDTIVRPYSVYPLTARDLFCHVRNRNWLGRTRMARYRTIDPFLPHILSIFDDRCQYLTSQP